MTDETPTKLYTDSYRDLLIEAEQKSQEAIDRTVLALSGGGIGISMTFIKDMLANRAKLYPALLTSAWICWVLSITAVLVSLFFSQRSLRHAIGQVDEKRIYIEHPGGWYSKATSCLNFSGVVFFLCGLVLVVILACVNQ